MPFRLRFIPGWKRFLLVLAPIALAIALLVGTYTFRWAGGGAAAPSPPANNPALDVPSQPGLLVHVVGAVENPGLHRLPHQLRWLPEHARAGRHPRHERDGLPRRAPVPDPMTRYPALVIALCWSAALAAAVVLIPGQPALGAIAIAATVPLLVL